MFGSSSVRYRLFLVRVNFKSIISNVSSVRISVRSMQVIQIRSLLPGLAIILDSIGMNDDESILLLDDLQ